MSSRSFTSVRYVRHVSQINDFPVTMSKDKLSAKHASNSTVQATCTKKFPPRAMLKWYMSKIYVHRIFPRKTCPSDLCSRNMPGLSCTSKMSEIKVLVAHADSLMCRALCPPPMAMGYVNTIYERRMATCGGYVPCTFLMSMVLVDMATRVYSTSTVKST